MPIEGGMNPGEADAALAAAATPPAEPQPSPQPATPPGQPTPTPTPPAATPPTPTPGQQAAFNLRQFANEHIPGVQDRYQSDEALAKELIQAAVQAQQMQPYAQIGQKFAPHMTAFEKWQREQEAAKQQQQAQTQQAWWQPPEYDPQWEKQVMIDPQTGRMVVIPGVGDPTVPARIEKYRQFQREVFDKLTRDPIGTLKEGLLPMIREEAQRIAQEQAAQAQANQFAASYIDRQIGWLAKKDAQGNPIRLPNGHYALTPAGERFNHHVQTLNSMGVLDPRAQAEIAEKMLMGELAQLQTQPAPQVPGQPQKPAFQTPGNQPNYGDTDVAKPNQSLKSMLTEAMTKAGLYAPPSPVV